MAKSTEKVSCQAEDESESSILDEGIVGCKTKSDTSLDISCVPTDLFSEESSNNKKFKRW
ncbi:multidrug/pheromone exporter, MDR family, ABC transporter family [Corchorus olitorius]|uniref:Multidrug/pheromone exporter, MDR family, ABC transporter family n=1 Tax=Corchorus olitorius TaxID=93759 RepID=A0A1R3GGR4_9ROSI|nr:multidrug/pheromone exporter, MDR family, ABC transporter family [Corchorus olitorius]